ncbi:MAG TPA: 3-deoxy-manno-octulosonate cytidylyltransferase [Syntrophales bacterium]|nr:3-deoxy-manno-octulosonate cytidylyltransferase [Syntrophales bacterium]HQN77609.1 3-deoxy-manno-octulosonate cytidylyltransferase [Syntrophales bacterium]HQQ26198.1 3-deoxy-manno-octulosonate cytidylyltransferase [Syntrophales bacterium]
MSDGKVVCLIPCRYHSTRFEGKPLAEILGKPMVRHVYERALRAKGTAFAAVVTDDERIASAVRSFGGQVILTGGHHRSGTDRLAEAADLLSLADEDIVVNIQGDQPTVQPGQVEEVAAPLTEDRTIPFATLAYPIRREEEIFHPNVVKVVCDRKGNALYFSRSPIPCVRDRKEKGLYFKHHGIYAYRKSFLTVFSKLPEGTLERFESLEQLRALENGYPVRVVISRFDSVEVDTAEDLKAVEACLRGESEGT